MITAIKQIGEFLNNQDFLKSLVLRNAKFHYIIVVNFDTISNTVQFAKEECSSEKLDEYLWIGHFRPKFHAVTSNFDDITGIINDYCDENKLKKNGRSNLHCYKNFKDRFSKIKDIEINDPKQKGLFVISIDNELICKNMDFKKVLHYEKIGQYFYKENIKLCSLCGNKVNSTSERYPFKFYNQDKKGFSSGLKGIFSNNFTICTPCLEKSYQGQAFIENNLISNIGKLKLYIIPHFVCFHNEQIKIERFVNPLKNIYNPAANISAMANFDERLKQFLKFDLKNKASFILNFMFYEKNKAQLLVKKLIKDVVPSRIESIISENININEKLSKFYSNYSISLSFLYRLLPLQLRDKKQKVDSVYYLELLRAIFKEERINTNQLISKFREGLKVIYYKQEENYSIGSSPSYVKNKFTIEKYMIVANYFLLFLTKTNNIKEAILENKPCLEEFNKLLQEKIKFQKEKAELLSGKSKANKEIMIKKLERIQNYLEEFKQIANTEQKIGLVFLGYLLGEVAYVQNRSLNSKPILKKINFAGMSLNDILKLSNSVIEKLQQYKVLDWAILFAYCKDQLISSNLDNWKLSKDENVFFIMTGYSLNAVYTNLKYIESPDELETENNDDDNEKMIKE